MLQIMGPTDILEVRSLVLSLLPPAISLIWLPDALLSSATVGGRAELVVIRRLGTDWVAIQAGTAPVIYASGMPSLAHDLLHSACVLYTCSFLCPMMRQIVAKQEKSELIERQLDLSWSASAKEFLAQAQETLGLLSPQTSVAGLRLAVRTPALIDPAATPLDVTTGFGPLFPRTEA